MVDLGLGEYITQVPSTRYPVYTRGNAGEVWPEVAYPLTITLTRKAGEIASAQAAINAGVITCLLYTSPSPRDRTRSRMPSSA